MTRFLSSIAMLALAASPAGAQRIADRVRAAGDRSVRMSFAARPDICGNVGGGISMRRSDGTTRMNLSNDGDWESECDYGPVRVTLSMRDGRVSSVRTHVGGRWRSSENAVDLGTVPAADAAAYLLELAQQGDGRAARDAILPAVMADSATVWPALLRIARDDDRPRDARRQALFWLGQAAGDAATASLDTIVADDDVDRDVREAAIFALSQRPRDEGIPALMRVARTSRDPELRRKALFWLGQSNDPRALDLFEEILTKR